MCFLREKTANWFTLQIGAFFFSHVDSCNFFRRMDFDFSEDFTEPRSSPLQQLRQEWSRHHGDARQSMFCLCVYLSIGHLDSFRCCYINVCTFVNTWHRTSSAVTLRRWVRLRPCEASPGPRQGCSSMDSESIFFCLKSGFYVYSKNNQVFIQ